MDVMTLVTAARSLAHIANGLPPKITQQQTTSSEQVNGGLTKSTATTSTATCANSGGNGPQAANCPDGHGSTTSSTTCNGVSNKPGKGNPTGPSPC